MVLNIDMKSKLFAAKEFGYRNELVVCLWPCSTNHPGQECERTNTQPQQSCFAIQKPNTRETELKWDHHMHVGTAKQVSSRAGKARKKRASVECDEFLRTCFVGCKKRLR